MDVETPLRITTRKWRVGGKNSQWPNRSQFCPEAPFRIVRTRLRQASSVGSPDRPNEGIAAGPLIRFLEAGGKPLKIAFSEDAWRSRVRTILKGA